jgi:hypothetical protein
MVDSKFFGIPFGTSGDRATIPEASQPSGAVSYTQGFGPDYERNPDTDPAAKRVPRDETNEYVYQMTNAIKYLQLYGLPEWYAVDGSGVAVSYPLTARVRYNAGAGMQAWVSIVAANTATPGSDATKWALDEAFSLTALEATQAEANAGLIGTKIITPRRMASAVQRGSWNFSVAGGTADVITATLSPVPAAYVDGMLVALRIATANATTTPTLNVNGLGAVTIQDPSGAALQANDLSPGPMVFIYRAGFFNPVNFFGSSETRRGSVELGSAAELTAGTDLTRAPSIGRIATQVQGGRWNYASAGGSTNAYTLTLVPALASYIGGRTIVVNFPSGIVNTGASTIDVNGLGALPITDARSNALKGGELYNHVQLTCVNGVSWVVTNIVQSTEALLGVSRFSTAAELIAGADLTIAPSVGRLATQVQRNSWLQGIIAGSANTYTLTLTPAITAYISGSIIFIGVPGALTNTGASTINVNGLGALPITDTRGNPLLGGEIFGQVMLTCKDGTSFVITNAAQTSETVLGNVRLATAAEVAAGSTFTQAIGPRRMSTQIQSGSWVYVATAGTANALTATLVPAITAYTAGLRVSLGITTTNTGAVTLNLNGLGVKTVIRSDGSPAQSADLQSGSIVDFIYDGTNFQISGLNTSFLPGRSVTTFSTAGTSNFTVPAGVFKIYGTVVGGGGGAGGAGQNGSGIINPAGGGGAGGSSEGWITVTPGQVISITVGAAGTGGAASANSPNAIGADGVTGGTSSIGAFMSATGGVKGQGTPSAGGAGGVGSGGQINKTGGNGTDGGGTAVTPVYGGNGGASSMGGGGRASTTPNSIQNGTAPGSGGGSVYATWVASAAGGAGAPGLVFLQY